MIQKNVRHLKIQVSKLILIDDSARGAAGVVAVKHQRDVKHENGNDQASQGILYIPECPVPLLDSGVNLNLLNRTAFLFS